jgi:hypothetical protein
MIDIDKHYDNKKRSIIEYILKKSSKYIVYNMYRTNDRVLFINIVRMFVDMKSHYITETIKVNRVYNYNLDGFSKMYKEKAETVYWIIRDDVFSYIKSLTII